MDASEIDEIPMLPSAYLHSDSGDGSGSRGLSTRTRSASMSIPSNEHNLVGPSTSNRQAPNRQMSGPLYANRNQEFVFQPPKGAYHQKAIEPKLDRTENNDWQVEDYMGQNEHLRTSEIFYAKKQIFNILLSVYKFHNMLHGDAEGMCSRMFPPINPVTRCVQRWNQFFVIACSFAVFLDPMFFFVLSVRQDNKCIVINQSMTTALIVLRSITDFIYFLHILLQFRLAYVAPESGDLVDDPKMIARNYFCGYFFVDFLVVLPLPQIIVLLILPGSVGASGANYAKNLLRAAILVQYIPRLYRLFLPLVAGPSSTGFIFESAWANFVINLLTFVLASHVVGSCWYLFGLQRVNQCFRDACGDSNIIKKTCMKFIDCGHGDAHEKLEGDPAWESWKNNENATACFGEDGFDFGIYRTAVNLTTQTSLIKRYVYSLFWGFQQISTLAGNQVPSYFEWEVLFTMVVIGIGLLLFALLIGNMQNFLQALRSRTFKRLEMSLRRRDVEQWMNHLRLPKDLRRQVRDSERFRWATTRGVNEEALMENLPEDLQREIRRHIFKFVKRVRIFQVLDEVIIDAIREKLKTKTYVERTKIMVRGGLVDKMYFIIRGQMVSEGEDGIRASMSAGEVCGEELLTWCLSSINKDGKLITLPGHRLLSNRKVTCLTNVEAIVLRGVDLEEVISLFKRFFTHPRVQGVIRYESPYWRGLAARRIQEAWRDRKKRINRADSSSPPRY